MKKQMKIAAVVSAAALLAIGASFTSMAAEKGTWRFEDGTWYCYDKDGDAYEDTFCLSNGKEFYVNEDGALEGSRWVEGSDDAMYYVNSAGEKIVNDWRLTTPYEDEDADEEWFYFDAKGKMVKSDKKVIGGKTYYFNADGVMLTGWVEYNTDEDVCEEATESSAIGKVVYCDENGARVSSKWIEAYAPGVDEDDADEDDLNWYYIKSKGGVQTKKASNIEGRTYLFDNNGKMLTGWVCNTGSNGDEYMEIWDDEVYALHEVVEAGHKVYFCDETDGDVKKNRWIKTWRSTEYEDADVDKTQKWFWIAKDGVVFVPAAEDCVTAVAQAFVDGEATVKFKNDGNASFVNKTLNDKTYAFNADGEMKSGLIKVTAGNEDIPEGMYYYGGGSDGARKDGAQTISDDCDADYKFYFSTEKNDTQGYKKAVGVTGAKSGKLYEDGLLVTSGDAKYARKTVTINGTDYEFIVNRSGSIQTSDKVYKDGDDVVLDATEDKVTFHKDSLDKGVKYGNFTEN